MNNPRPDISDFLQYAQKLFLGLKILNPKSEVTIFINAFFTQFCRKSYL